MKDFELSIEQKKREIIEDRLNKIRDEGHTGEVSILIKYLGRGKDTGKDFFSIADNYSGMNNEFFYEYLDELKELPLIRNELTDGKVIRANNFQETPEETKEIEDSIQDIERCIEDRYKEMKAIAKQLGIDEKEINSISEIDLEQKIEDKELEKQKEKEQDKNETKQITEEEAEKIGIKGNGMNSAKMNVAVDTKGNTLGKELGLEEYDSILVVHSYKLAELSDADGKNGKVYNFPLALIGRTKDGNLEIIPETKLRPYRGANKEVTEINDKEDVEVKNEECIFEVPNSNKRIAINQKDPYGIPEIYYGKSDKENEGNVMQSVQDERDGTQRKDVEVRALFNRNKGEYQIDKMHDEGKKHLDKGCKDIDSEEVDGDENTGHVHFDPQDIEQQKAIEDIMEKGKVSKEEATRLFATNLEDSRDNQKEGQDRIEEAKEKSLEEINEQARGSRGGKRDN